jgi:hypothetical protein
MRIINALFFVVFLSAYAAYSQTFSYKSTQVKICEELIDFYGIDYLNKLIETNAELILYQNYFAKNSFEIIDAGAKSQSEEYSKISILPINNRKIIQESNIFFNVLNYEIQLINVKQYFIIDRSNYAVCFKTKKEFLKDFNDYKTKL